MGHCYPECVHVCMPCVWCSTYIAVSLPELLKTSNESSKCKSAFTYTTVTISPLPVSYHSTASQIQDLIHMGHTVSCFSTNNLALVFWNHHTIILFFSLVFFFQWKQEVLSTVIGKVLIQQDQNFTGLIAGLVSTAVLIFIVLVIFIWRRKKKQIKGPS